jgi:RNA polymerase sigma factor (sigma-70 family)
MLADPGSEDAYEVLPRRLAAEQLSHMLVELNERERTIISGRFGLDGDEQTLRELAGRFGVSAERVRQIEQGALQKLAAAVSAPPCGIGG